MSDDARDQELDVDQHHYTPAGQVGAGRETHDCGSDEDRARWLGEWLAGHARKPAYHTGYTYHPARCVKCRGLWPCMPSLAADALDAATARSAAALEIVGELAESELVDEDENTVTCLYCGQTMLRGLQVSYIAHRPDCVYLRARRLVGEEGE